MSSRNSSSPLELAKSMRPQTVLPQWAIFAGAVILLAGIRLSVLALGLVLLLCVYGVAALLNDLSDKETDIANERKDIPLATKSVTSEQIAGLLLALSVMATAIAIVMGRQALLWVSVYVVLAWLYSGPVAIKSRGVWALILLGFCYAFLPWWLAVATLNTGFTLQILLVSIVSWAFTVGIIALKDFKDEDGDRKTGKITFLVRHGPLATQRLMLLLTSIAYVGLIAVLVIYHRGLFGIFVAVAALLNGRLLANKKILISGSFRANAGRLSRWIFFAAAVSSLALLRR